MLLTNELILCLYVACKHDHSAVKDTPLQNAVQSAFLCIFITGLETAHEE